MQLLYTTMTMSLAIRSYISLTIYIAPKVSAFLRKDVNKGFAERERERVNRGAWLRLEVPCTYRLYEPKVYVDKECRCDLLDI